MVQFAAWCHAKSAHARTLPSKGQLTYSCRGWRAFNAVLLCWLACGSAEPLARRHSLFSHLVFFPSFLGCFLCVQNDPRLPPPPLGADACFLLSSIIFPCVCGCAQGSRDSGELGSPLRFPPACVCVCALLCTPTPAPLRSQSTFPVAAQCPPPRSPPSSTENEFSTFSLPIFLLVTSVPGASRVRLPAQKCEVMRARSV